MGPGIRAAVPADYRTAVDVALASGLFEESERELVTALLADAFSAPERVLLISEDAGRAVGVLDARPREATDGTWELTLIAVDRSAQGSGIGRALVRRLEHELAARRARLLLVETSDRSEFATPRKFYAALDFTEVARIADVYADGDGMVVFAERLPVRPH